MVNNIWCRKFTHIWHQKAPEPPHARLFTESRYQTDVSCWYLTYRCLISIAWLTIIVCSILELGSARPLGKSYLWPIYLTHWDLVLGLGQSLCGLYLTIRRWQQQNSPDFDANALKYGRIEMIYWFLYTITASLAVGVTGTYWATVYDNTIHKLDPLNIMLHVCNSLLMGVDLLVTRIPLRIRHCWWAVAVTTFYLMFTVVYHAAGGLDKLGNPCIYKILNWAKPGVTILVCLGGLAFLVIVHCLLCYLVRLRDRIYTASQKYKINSPGTPANDQPLKVKSSEVV